MNAAQQAKALAEFEQKHERDRAENQAINRQKFKDELRWIESAEHQAFAIANFELARRGLPSISFPTLNLGPILARWPTSCEQGLDHVIAQLSETLKRCENLVKQHDAAEKAKVEAERFAKLTPMEQTVELLKREVAELKAKDAQKTARIEELEARQPAATQPKRKAELPVMGGGMSVSDTQTPGVVNSFGMEPAGGRRPSAPPNGPVARSPRGITAAAPAPMMPMSGLPPNWKAGGDTMSQMADASPSGDVTRAVFRREAPQPSAPAASGGQRTPAPAKAVMSNTGDMLKPL